MKQGKVWGQTEELIRTPLVEVHRIHINPEMRCSMHKHNQKWNMFYVIEGRLAIDVEKNDYALVDTTVLEAGEWTSVKPGEYHQFRSLDVPVVALEIYYLEPLFTDIVRKNVGGADIANSLTPNCGNSKDFLTEDDGGSKEVTASSEFAPESDHKHRTHDLTGRDDETLLN